VQGTLLPSPEEARGCFGTDRFDFILAREPWRKGFFGASAQEAFRSFAAASRLLLDQGTCVSVLQSPPKWGQRIGALLKGGDPEAEELAMRLEKAEDVFFNDPSAKTLSGTSAGAPAASPDASPDAGAAQKSSRWTWDPLDIEQSMTEVGLFVETSIIEHAEERVISEKDIGMWFDQEHSPWGKSMAEQLGNEDCIRLRQLFSSRASAGPMEWRWKTALLRCAIG
jgi:putative ATPase